jgi:hypothetical protein
VIGKPARWLFAVALEQLGVAPAHALMVGNRLETDILGGQQAGLHTALVPTSFESAAAVAPKDIRPDLVVGISRSWCNAGGRIVRPLKRKGAFGCRQGLQKAPCAARLWNVCSDLSRITQTFSSGSQMKPFLKWAGGKARIVDRIKAVLPAGERLVEPFVGSGALSLNAEYPAYKLADANRDLINCYQQLQTGGMGFIEACAAYFVPAYNQPDAYYVFRERFNSTANPVEKAAIFVYLNRHGYNGLCRYNGSGGFNVPFGRYTRPYFPRKRWSISGRSRRGASFPQQIS